MDTVVPKWDLPGINLPTYPALLAARDFGVLKILQEWCVFCNVDMLVVNMLDERVASSEYRYSAGNAMGIVVVKVDREEVECCATARSPTTQSRTTYRHVKYA
jgi:hypothetical protein